MNTETHIGEWLASTGRNAKALADYVGRPVQWVSRVRNGHAKPSRGEAVAIEKFTDGAVPITVWGYE